MENSSDRERAEIYAMLAKSLREDDYSEWTPVDLLDARRTASDARTSGWSRWGGLEDIAVGRVSDFEAGRILAKAERSSKS